MAKISNDIEKALEELSRRGGIGGDQRAKKRISQSARVKIGFITKEEEVKRFVSKVKEAIGEEEASKLYIRHRRYKIKSEIYTAMDEE